MPGFPVCALLTLTLTQAGSSISGLGEIKDQQGWQHSCGGGVITSGLGERTIA